MREFAQRSGARPVIREMVEMVLGLGCVIGLGWWIPVAWRPSHLVFCAFFSVVFAIAVRYRPLVAYTTSLLAALGYGVLLWLRPELRVQPDFLYIALEPFLLLCSGIIISDILHWQLLRLAMLEQKCAHVCKILQETQGQYQMALTHSAALERQIVSQSTSISTMSAKVSRLWSRADDECYAAIVDIVAYGVEIQSCGLYMRQNDLWKLRAERSIEDLAYAPLLNTDDPLIKRVIELREVSTIRDALAEERSVPREVAVMAGPLLAGDGELVGMVVIDTMALRKFTPGTVGLFRSLLHMVSISLQTAGRERSASVSMA